MFVTGVRVSCWCVVACGLLFEALLLFVVGVGVFVVGVWMFDLRWFGYQYCWCRLPV